MHPILNHTTPHTVNMGRVPSQKDAGQVSHFEGGPEDVVVCGGTFLKSESLFSIEDPQMLIPILE